MENQSLAENKNAVEYVVGNLVIILVGLIALSFFHWNIFSSLALALLGAVIGWFYSKRKFQKWSSYVEWKIVEDTKHPTIFQRFLSFVYLIILWVGLDMIRKYAHISFEILTGCMEILVGSYLGYFLWLIWLHNGLNKKADKVL